MKELNLRRMADPEDVLEFKVLLDEAQKILEENTLMVENIDLLTPIRNKAIGNTIAVEGLKKLILQTCNILEESPITQVIALGEREDKRAYTDEEKEVLEQMNWQSDPPENREMRQRLIQRLIKLKDAIH